MAGLGDLFSEWNFFGGADPSFTLTGDAWTDIAGDSVSGPSNFNSSTFSLSGDEGGGGAFGLGAPSGSPFSFVNPLSGDSVPGTTRGIIADPTAGTTLGWNDGEGNLVDLQGQSIRPTSFGGFNSNLSSGASPGLGRFIDALRSGASSAADLLGPREDDARRGGGGLNISAPQISSPTAERIPMLQVPQAEPTPMLQVPQPQTSSVMTAPVGRDTFEPMMLPNAPPEPSLRGLEQLFRRGAR